MTGILRKRYAEVAQRLASDIAAGVHPVGSILPTEHELARVFGVSRSTVRAALGELQGLGLVSRRPSRGTRVEAALPALQSGGYIQAIGSIESLIQYAASTKRVIVDVQPVVVDAGLAAKTGLKAGSRWLHVSQLRFNPDEPAAPPVCWTDVYVHQAFETEVSTRIAARPGAISEIIEELAGRRVIEIEQTLRATGVPMALAEPLMTPADGHALEITRSYHFAANELVEVSVSLYPSERFAYTSRLVRND